MAAGAWLVIAPQDYRGDQVLDLAALQRAPLPALSDPRHPVATYLSGLDAPGRRPRNEVARWSACTGVPG